MKLPDKITGLSNEFKTFVLKGNVMDLAVAVILGAAFKTVVDSMVGDVITPVTLIISRQAPLMAFVNGIASFLGALMKFLMNAAIIFFVFVKPMNKLKAIMARRQAENPADVPPVPDDIKLLTEIRDLLKGAAPTAPAVPAAPAEPEPPAPTPTAPPLPPQPPTPPSSVPYVPPPKL